MQVTGKLFEAGANIEDLSRSGTGPIEVAIEISGLTENQVQTVLATIDAGTDFSLTYGA
jgi:hypothetical protein